MARNGKHGALTDCTPANYPLGSDEAWVVARLTWEALQQAKEKFNAEDSNDRKRISEYMHELLSHPVISLETPPARGTDVPWKIVVALIKASGSSLIDVLAPAGQNMSEPRRRDLYKHRLALLNQLCERPVASK